MGILSGNMFSLDKIKNRKATSLISSERFMQPGELNCLYVSIAIAILKINHKEPPKANQKVLLCAYQKILLDEVNHLMKLAGVVAPKPDRLPGPDEFRALQNALVNYVTYSQVRTSKRDQWRSSSYNLIIFNLTGDVEFQGIPLNKNRKIQNIDLLYNDRHFDVIKSRSSVFACNFMCNFCHKKSEGSIHKNCFYTCLLCLSNPPCKKANETMCDECGRTFLSKHCYENHLTGKVCKRVRYCKKCNRLIRKGHDCERF